MALQAGLEGTRAVLQCKHRQCWGSTSTAEGSDCEELGQVVAQGAQCGLLWLSLMSVWLQMPHCTLPHCTTAAWDSLV